MSSKTCFAAVTETVPSFTQASSSESRSAESGGASSASRFMTRRTSPMTQFAAIFAGMPRRCTSSKNAATALDSVRTAASSGERPSSLA